MAKIIWQMPLHNRCDTGAIQPPLQWRCRRRIAANGRIHKATWIWGMNINEISHVSNKAVSLRIPSSWISRGHWRNISPSIRMLNVPNYTQQCYGHSTLKIRPSVTSLVWVISEYTCQRWSRDPSLYTLINSALPLDKMATISQTIFHARFREWKFCIFYINVTKVCSWGPNSQRPSISLYSGLAPKKRQAIIWTNADPIRWRIYAARMREESIIGQCTTFCFRWERVSVSYGIMDIMSRYTNMYLSEHLVNFFYSLFPRTPLCYMDAKTCIISVDSKELKMVCCRTHWAYEMRVISCYPDVCRSLRWRHNGRDGVLNHQPYGCLLNRLFRLRSERTSKLRVTGLCAGNSPGTSEFPAQMASNAENVSISWRHHLPWDNSAHAFWWDWRYAYGSLFSTGQLSMTQ